MADEKKPPAFDPDKTIVDVRRSGPTQPPANEADRTMVSPSKPAAAPPPAEQDSSRTVVFSRADANKAIDESDRTIVGRAPAKPADAGDRTVIQPAGAAPRAPVPSGPAEYQIVALSGPHRGRQFPIYSGNALVGSSSTCTIVVPGLEPLHVKISKGNEGYEIQNLGSSNSLIAGKRVTATAKLASGDLIKVGEVVFRFVQIGEMFSSDYQEADLQSSGAAAMIGTLKEKPVYAVVGALVVLLGLVLLWPAQEKKALVQPKPKQSADQARQKEVDALLAAGEVLFSSAKFVAPPDQPEADNAYSKFNDVLALDPGNEKAKDWLKKIDSELDKVRREREEAEKRKLAAEQARKTAQRAELEKKVSAILAAGDEYFAKGQVTEPVGSNALAKYREALKVDPESAEAQQRVEKAANYWVQRGDELRDKGDSWSALENYRKASRATLGKDETIEKRIVELEGQLRSGMAGTSTKLVIYRDDKGQLFVLDDMEKVPSRYRDRAVEVNPAPPPKR